MKTLTSMSLSTLNYLSTEALYEILDDKNYDEQTKSLARRVINSRKY